MTKIKCDLVKDGFYGTYYIGAEVSKCAFIGLFGDDPNDLMAKCGSEWFADRNINTMCISPGKKDYSHVNLPIERTSMQNSKLF